jgi:phospholipase/lecithinase/hemolysin
MSYSGHRLRVYARSGLVVACVALSSVMMLAQQSPYERIVVFGTSFSDSGNTAIVVGSSTPPSYDVDEWLVPNLPYARGGHHLSNGPTWIEQLARSIGLGGSVQPALRTKGAQGTNYAVGASRAIPSPGHVTLNDQVNLFLAEFNGIAPPDALYVMEMGANDVSDALAAVAQGQNAFAILDAAVQSIVGHIQLLHAAGARHFLVGNVPSPGYAPAVRALDPVFPGTSLLARDVAVAFNQILSVALDSLEALQGITITRVDAFATLDRVMADPLSFGFSNVDDACIMPNTPPFKCQQPNSYFFWDGVHATTAGASVFAREAALQLGLN